MKEAAIIFMNGLTNASLLFVVSSGLTLVYGLMRIVNMAHGSFYLLAAGIGYFTYKSSGSWWLALLVGAAALTVFSFLLQVTLFKRVLEKPMLGTLLTLGISMVIVDAVLWFSKGAFQIIDAPSYIARPIDLGIIKFPGNRLFILLVAIIEIILLSILIQRTKLGMTIRAGVNDQKMVSALGINITKIFAFTFVLAGFLVGLGGVLGGSLEAFYPGVESKLQMNALMIIIVGGQGSIIGCAAGALLIGLLDSATKFFMPNYSSIIVFGVVMLILLYKPLGLFGVEGRKS